VGGADGTERGGVTTWTRCDSPLGPLLLVGEPAGLAGLYLDGHTGGPSPRPGWRRDDDGFADVVGQLAAYFAGTLRAFDLPLAPAGTAFQRRVWQALREIPYAATRSYGALARGLGLPGGSRAVGLANGRNPLSVVVPCHRVIGADGRLTGYGGGLDRKRWLLDHERAHAGAAPALW
jgi:methylated-DNA-[protein]-cysteine S-methyltransferase